MSKRVILSAAVLALAVTGCGGGDDAKTSAKPSASKAYSDDAKECFTGVIKAVDKMLEASQGNSSDIMSNEEFGAFGKKAQGTPTWDIYVEYRDMGIKDLTNGVHATATDAVAAYAPSVKLECVKAYG
ncbi:hypothetical protein [Streptomyces sp. NPDC047869]|uniref:hypothetical protein n=1 Tax=Streptomyces sp. NPDC047869 TaxID=3154709 RepID=UPI0034569354